MCLKLKNMKLKPGSRHWQVLLMTTGMIITFTLRTNISFGIVAMTSENVNPNFTVLNWTTQEKGVVLSAFFWGNPVLQIPAGHWARRYGPCKFLAGTLLLCGILTVLTPLAATKSGLPAVIAIRVLIGVAQGIINPSLNTHLSKWAIPDERNRIYGFVFGSSQLGVILTLVFGGVLSSSAGGWPSIFYITGGLGIGWGVLCAVYGADSPEKHRTISKKERAFIESHLIHNSESSSEMATPWKSIITSVPLIALIIIDMGQKWGYWTLQTLLPSYLGGALGVAINNNGFLSAIPYIAMCIATFACSFLADFIDKKRILSTNVSRKMWQSISHYGGAIALVGLAFVSDIAGAVTLLTITLALNSGGHFGYLINHLDLAPNFAGLLMGITSGFGAVAAAAGPLVAGAIIQEETNLKQWQIVFLISACIFVITNTVFIIFGSTKLQRWNGPEKDVPKVKTSYYN